MRLLIQSGADINAYRNDGCTPLHIAATFPSTNHIKCQLLIDHGADLHAQAGGLTPHDYAIAQGFHDTAKFLENPIKYRNAWPAADRPPDVPVRTPESTPFGEGSDRMPTNVDPVDVSILATTAAIEIAAVQALVAQQQEVSRSDNTDGAVLDVDWKLILDKTGIHSRLAAMQASIAASESAQRALRDANKALDGRVAANAAAIREHEHRIAQLEEQREVQSAQVSMLQSLESKPDHLLFYHTLQINIEAVFLSCKAVAGGFVDLGGDALSNRALTGTSNAIKVCGALLSLAPGGAIIKGVANVGAAALEHANSTRRQNIAHKLGKSMSLAEASQVASDVAYRLTLMFAEQLALLVSADTTSGASTKGSSGGGFPAFLKRACGVGGNLVAAYVTSGDGCEVIATAAEMAGDAVSESVGELIAAQSGALVGSVRGGPEPFASVLADFCFLVVLAELENVRVSETASDISKRLVRAVVMLKPTASADARASGGSGARRLLDRLCGFARSIMSSRPSRTLSVFVHSHDGASHGAPAWCEVSVVDLLTCCGVRTKTGRRFSASHCKTDLFGWCEATEEVAGDRGLVDIGGPRGAAGDIAFEALIRTRMAEEFEKQARLKHNDNDAMRPQHILAKNDDLLPNEYARTLYGKCIECRQGECEEYGRRSDGAADCGVCKHAVHAHHRLGPRPQAPSSVSRYHK